MKKENSLRETNACYATIYFTVKERRMRKKKESLVRKFRFSHINLMYV